MHIEQSPNNPVSTAILNRLLGKITFLSRIDESPPDNQCPVHRKLATGMEWAEASAPTIVSDAGNPGASRRARGSGRLCRSMKAEATASGLPTSMSAMIGWMIGAPGGRLR